MHDFTNVTSSSKPPLSMFYIFSYIGCRCWIL